MNKVIWGLAKLGWGTVTDNADSSQILGDVNLLTGSRKVSFSPKGDIVPVYADGTIIYKGRQNSGYDGSIEMTAADEDFVKYILDEVVDDNNVQIEREKTAEKKFYVVWEWEADSSNTRHIMYNLTANRMAIEGTTAGDGGSKSPQYETIPVTASPRYDGIVKAKTRSDVNSVAYSNWFTNAYEPTASIVIDLQPGNVTTDVGATESIIVAAHATDGTALTYQWYSNTTKSTIGGVSITGATSAEYTVPTSAAGTTYYYCEVISATMEDVYSAIAKVVVR